MSRSEDAATYRVRVRQVHHAWHTVTAASAVEARALARRQAAPEWVEFGHDLPPETWNVYDEYGGLVLEGDAAGGR